MINNFPTSIFRDSESLLQFIQQKQLHVFQKINTALIDLYWDFGKILSKKAEVEKWGKSVIKEFAGCIISNAPDSHNGI